MTVAPYPIRCETRLLRPAGSDVAATWGFVVLLDEVTDLPARSSLPHT